MSADALVKIGLRSSQQQLTLWFDQLFATKPATLPPVNYIQVTREDFKSIAIGHPKRKAMAARRSCTNPSQFQRL
jgi:hypothetical protein